MSGDPRKSGELYMGAAMAVTLTFSLRAIGLVSVFILARLLSPADFGVVGLAMTAVAIVEVFSYLGLRQALLRLPGPDREYYDTAWTIQLIVFSVLALVLVALAAPAAAFYDEPRVAPVIAALAARFVMLGLTNIGVVEFDRDLDFGRDLKMRAAARVLSFVVTVGLALALHSYWALVAGMIVQSLVLTGLSYVMQPYRPRLSLARRAELLGVSLWIFVGVAAQSTYSQIDRIIVGRSAGTGVVGAYAVSKDLANILTLEIATALNRVTFVETARRGAFAEQGARIANSLGGYAMIAAPIGFGLAALASEFIAVFLGEQWAPAAPLMPPIAVASAVFAVYKLIASSLQAGGHERASACLSMGGVITLFAGVSLVAWRGGGPLEIAQTGVVASVALLVAAVFVIAQRSRFAAVDYLAAAARPFFAAGIMYGVLVALPVLSETLLVELVAKAAIGAAVYTLLLLALWAAGGRPLSAEAEIVRVLRTQLARI